MATNWRGALFGSLILLAIYRFFQPDSALSLEAAVRSPIFSSVLNSVSLGSLASPAGGASDGVVREPRPTKYRHRIVALGDLHGDLPHALRCLRLAGVVDLRGKWVAKGGVTLVQTGDIVDRGDDVIALYRLFDRLREEAPRSGGRVVSLLGNHEYMSASGDWRYATPGDIASFGGERGRRRAMSSEGWLGKAWMANYSTTARVPYPLTFSSAPAMPLSVDDTPESTSSSSLFHMLNTPPQTPFNPPSSSGPPQLESSDTFSFAAASFVHGGLTAKYAALGVSEINRLGSSLLNRSLSASPPSPVHLPPDTPASERDFYGADGPVWYRGWALDPDGEELCNRVEKVCRLLGVRRLIIGHTPHFEGITSRCEGKILIIDTGISSAYGGALSALDITYTLTPVIPTVPLPADDPTAVPVPVKVTPGDKIKWVERELVSALQEGKPKKTLARRERTLEIPWYP